ncbi:hypothetical protein GEV33_005139 [Tenebrio molitor]|uniref:Uncharacterized protein n=1 Tax=Tenebrio molitor TaxID=7067 RepID=A0A8J6HNF1_TENMO|nr:hypothetical protein GEV33_005139 [Tenebrio molitor]
MTRGVASPGPGGAAKVAAPWLILAPDSDRPYRPLDLSRGRRSTLLLSGMVRSCLTSTCLLTPNTYYAGPSAAIQNILDLVVVSLADSQQSSTDAVSAGKLKARFRSRQTVTGGLSRTVTPAFGIAVDVILGTDRKRKRRRRPLSDADDVRIDLVRAQATSGDLPIT